MEKKQQQTNAASCTGRIIKETNDTSACVWVLLDVWVPLLQQLLLKALQVCMVTSAGQSPVLQLSVLFCLHSQSEAQTAGRPLLAGYSTVQKLLPLCVSRWDMSQTRVDIKDLTCVIKVVLITCCSFLCLVEYSWFGF